MSVNTTLAHCLPVESVWEGPWKDDGGGVSGGAVQGRADNHTVIGEAS